MSKFIIVHNSDDGKEYALNTEHIESFVPRTFANGCVIHFANGNRFMYVNESFDEVWGKIIGE